MWTPEAFQVRGIPADNIIHVTDSLAVRQTRQNTSLFFQHTSQSNFVTDFYMERRFVPQAAPQASKKAFAAGCTTGKKALAALQARRL